MIRAAASPRLQIVVFAWQDGAIRARFGPQGAGVGFLQSPWSVALLRDRPQVLVSDSKTNRVSQFNLTGGLPKVVCKGTQTPMGVSVPHTGNGVVVCR